MVSYKTVLVEKKDRIATITLNRPEKLNAIDPQLMRDLYSALEEIENDGVSRVVVLRGAGRAFSTGFDLGRPEEEREPLELPMDPQVYRKFWALYLKPLKYMVNYPKPVIGAIHGYVIAAGLWMMAACDIIYATEDCKFGFPEIRHGAETIIFMIPANTRRNVWLEHALTGTFFDAKEAEQMGLINRAIPNDRFEKEVYNLAKRIALVDPIALEHAKLLANQFFGIPQLDGLIEYAIQNSAVLLSTETEPVKELLTPLNEGKITLKEFLRKRDGKFRELEKELEEIRKTQS